MRGLSGSWEVITARGTEETSRSRNTIIPQVKGAGKHPICLVVYMSKCVFIKAALYGKCPAWNDEFYMTYSNLKKDTTSLMWRLSVYNLTNIMEWTYFHFDNFHCGTLYPHIKLELTSLKVYIYSIFFSIDGDVCNVSLFILQGIKDVPYLAMNIRKLLTLCHQRHQEDVQLEQFNTEPKWL